MLKKNRVIYIIKRIVHIIFDDKGVNIMKRFVRSIGCIMLCAALAISFAACSKKPSKSETLNGLTNEMTAENVTATVEAIEKGLKDFDTDVFDACVSSETLEYIISFAKNHEQFSQLGKDIFANLSMEIVNIDLQAKTVTVSVTNKYLYTAASDFTYELLADGKMNLISKLDDEAFLDKSLARLEEDINSAEMIEEPVEVTLTIAQGEEYLKLTFDEDAEAAVSGRALTAVKDGIG